MSLFFQNLAHANGTAQSIPATSLLMRAFNVYETVAMGTLQLVVSHGSSGTRSHTVSIGIYSRTGDTLTLVNSVSSSSIKTTIGSGLYFTMTNFSSAQTLDPGTWYIGILTSGTGGATSNMSFMGAPTDNQFTGNEPGFFRGAYSSATTNALPVSGLTSDFSTFGTSSKFTPYILITS